MIEQMIFNKVADIYGKEHANSITKEILALIEKWKPSAPQYAPWVDEHTSYLITYGDSFARNDEKTLSSMKIFADKYPFSDVPAESIEEPANYIISHNSEAWVQLVDPKMKGQTPDESSWTTLDSAPKEMKNLMKKFTQNHVVKENDESGMSKGAIAGLSVGLTTAVCVIVGIAIAVRRNQKRKRGYNSVE